MKKMIKKAILWTIVVVCGLGIIGAGFELGTSDPAQTEPAVTGGQMNMVVVTIPTPIATMAMVQTRVTTRPPTTVVTTVSTTKPIQKSATSPIVTPAICVPSKEWDYSFGARQIGSSMVHTVNIENRGETTLSKTLEFTFKEGGITKYVSLSVEVPPGERKRYSLYTDNRLEAEIELARCD